MSWAWIELTFRLPDGRVVEHIDTDSWEDVESARLWWDDGNGDCDCNRSRELRRAGVDIEEMECGDTIELLSFNVIPSTPTPPMTDPRGTNVHSQVPLRTVHVVQREYVPGCQVSGAQYIPPHYEMVDKGLALFHCFGSQHEEFENGVGNTTVAIVEFPDGTVSTVLPSAIRFIEPNIVSSPIPSNPDTTNG